MNNSYSCGNTTTECYQAANNSASYQHSAEMPQQNFSSNQYNTIQSGNYVFPKGQYEDQLNLPAVIESESNWNSEKQEKPQEIKVMNNKDDWALVPQQNELQTSPTEIIHNFQEEYPEIMNQESAFGHPTRGIQLTETVIEEEIVMVKRRKIRQRSIKVDQYL